MGFRAFGLTVAAVLAVGCGDIAVAGGGDLATEEEVKDLRRTVRSLEEQIAELQKQQRDKPAS